LVGASAHLLWLLVQLHLKSRGVPVFWISMVSTLNAAGMLAGGLFWGTVSDHVRRNRLLALLIVGLFAATAVLAFLPPPSVILWTSVIRSLLFSGTAAVTTAIVSAASAPERRGKNLSYISSARAVGFALGALGSGFLLEALGYQFSFAVSGVLCVASLLFFLRLPPEITARRPRSTGVLRHAIASGLGDLYVALALRQMSVFGAFALLYVYMDSLGISPGVMGVVSSLNMLTQIGALVAFGWLADRLGRRRVFMLGFALSALIPCHFVLFPNLYGMILGYVTLGFGYSALHVGATAHIGDRTTEERQGQMLGLYESSRGLGGLLGPVLAGGLVPAIGFPGMFLVMAGISALGFLLMLARPVIHRLSGVRPA